MMNEMVQDPSLLDQALQDRLMIPTTVRRRFSEGLKRSLPKGRRKHMEFVPIKGILFPSFDVPIVIISAFEVQNDMHTARKKTLI